MSARNEGTYRVALFIAAFTFVGCILAVASAVLLFIFYPPSSPPPLAVSARMAHSALIDNGTQQLLAFSFNVTSHMKEPAELAEVVAKVTTESGATVTIVVSPGSPSVSVASVTASLASPARLALPPSGSQTLYVNLTAPASNPITSVSFELVFMTSGGKVMTFSTGTYCVSTIYPTP